MDTLQAAAPLPPDIRWMRRAALALLGLGVLLGLAMLLSLGGAVGACSTGGRCASRAI
jgi:hypothetical protein